MTDAEDEPGDVLEWCEFGGDHYREDCLCEVVPVPKPGPRDTNRPEPQVHLLPGEPT